MESWELVDNYFCKICNANESDLTVNDSRLIQVWHSFGRIQGSGLHVFLSEGNNDLLEAKNAYQALGLNKCFDAIESVSKLWEIYNKNQTNSHEVDSDEFRILYSDEIDALEEDFYNEEDNVVETLLSLISTSA